LNRAGLPGYSATALEHFRHPRNIGRLENANAVGAVDDLATENFVSFYLLIEAGRIAAARFRTFGCSACVAASSVVTELAEGKSVGEARAIDAKAVLRALDGLPAGKRHCAELAARALAAALANYGEASVRPSS
jgi:NifU-like protein involved in Fe-S cluster formation